VELMEREITEGDGVKIIGYINTEAKTRKISQA
jgi:hypothetical protein